jgi:threonyl-tRNA synthetase
MLIVGDREQEDERVSVREHRHGDMGTMGVRDFIAHLQEQVQTRASL